MSAYPPPLDFLPIFNEIEYPSTSNSLTITSADLRYLKLTGGTESGLVSFDAGLSATTIDTNVNNSNFNNAVSNTSGFAGSDVAYSNSYINNLTKWNSNSQTVLNSNVWTSIVWSSSIGLFAAVSNSGSSRVAYSTDGINFTYASVSSTLNSVSWNCVIWISDLSLFVACGSGSVMTSSDGLTWTAQTADTTSSWASLAYSSSLGLIVATATSGTNRIMTSSNGTSWTIRSPPNTNSWTAVAWSPTLALFAAIANDNDAFKAMYSSNGTAWTQTTAADEAFNNGAKWSGIVWCSEISQFIACANGSWNGINNDPVLMTSGNGTGWSAVGGSSTAGLYKNYKSLCWLSELSSLVVLANDSNAITTYNTTSGWVSSSSTNLVSLDLNALAWSSSLGILSSLSGSGSIRGFYSYNCDTVRLNDPSLFGQVKINDSLDCGRTAVTQTTSNSTSVTINSVSGRITMFGGLTGAAPDFTVNNSCCKADSVVIASVGQASLPLDGSNAFCVWVGSVANGSFKLQVYNILVANNTNPVVIHFLIC